LFPLTPPPTTTAAIGPAANSPPKAQLFAHHHHQNSIEGQRREHSKKPYNNNNNNSSSSDSCNSVVQSGKWEPKAPEHNHSQPKNNNILLLHERHTANRAHIINEQSPTGLCAMQFFYTGKMAAQFCLNFERQATLVSGINYSMPI
jgi:hypothetical protein